MGMKKVIWQRLIKKETIKLELLYLLLVISIEAGTLKIVCLPNSIPKLQIHSHGTNRTQQGQVAQQHKNY